MYYPHLTAYFCVSIVGIMFNLGIGVFYWLDILCRGLFGGGCANMLDDIGHLLA